MVTKNQIKLVTSLQQKKYRTKHGLFVVEGKKAVRELLDEGFKCFLLFVDNAGQITNFEGALVVSASELKQMSGMATPSGIVGVFHIPEAKKIETSDWIVAVDAVRDPGNLGTIIRLCDWFGIENLICSIDTVDCYNPKVLQATMGSIARVNVSYVDLTNYLESTGLPIFGAYMGGESVYGTKFPKEGILIMGNEANGISKEVGALIQKRVSIPQFGNKTAESLNVATATAILLNEIRRK